MQCVLNVMTARPTRADYGTDVGGAAAQCRCRNVVHNVMLLLVLDVVLVGVVVEVAVGEERTSSKEK